MPFSIRPAVDFDRGLCATTSFTDLLFRMPCGYYVTYTEETRSGQAVQEIRGL